MIVLLENLSNAIETFATWSSDTILKIASQIACYVKGSRKDLCKFYLMVWLEVTRQSDSIPYSYIMLVNSNVRVLLFRGILEKADKIFQMHSNNAVSELFIFQELVPAWNEWFCKFYTFLFLSYGS